MFMLGTNISAMAAAAGGLAWDWYEMINALLQAPVYHLMFEGALILWIVWLLFTKSYKPMRTVLTEQEKKTLVEEWEPEPLVPEVPSDNYVLQNIHNRLIDSKVGKCVSLNGKECLNFATLNFLGMVGRKDIEEAAIRSLRKYGVGSCGPRGFYGTVDVHLELEEKLAKFMQCEEAIIYSYGFATIASAIPAYSKRGDIIFCDEGVDFAIQKGILASRSQVKYFKHNDMRDLERLLKSQEADDKKNPAKAKVTRRFLVVEGLYLNLGDIAPLPKLLELKERYRVRLFIDESVSFGVLGAHGRGITEHYGISIDEVDMICSSLENALASEGGFCCGKSYIVDHQRLSGLGYCFSASQPPLLATAAIQALELLEEQPAMTADLKRKCKFMHKELAKLNTLTVVGEEVSPVKHLRLTVSSDDRRMDLAQLQDIITSAEAGGVALTLASFLEKEENFLLPPSIRISVNRELTEEEIIKGVQVLRDSCEKVLR